VGLRPYRRELRRALLQPQTDGSILKMQRGQTKMIEQTKESRKVRENLTADEKQRLKCTTPSNLDAPARRGNGD
jgi:hypothetical protein